MSGTWSKNQDVEVADLRPGRAFQARSDGDEDEHVEVFEVVSRPFFDDNPRVPGWKIKVRSLCDESLSDRYLSDLGIEPYEDGDWNARKLAIVDVPEAVA